MRQEMTKEAAEEFLELPRRYTKADLRRAYTEMARRYHPDAAAKNHFDPAAAQAQMVEANKAHDVLRREFADAPDRVVERGGGGIARGYAAVDWRADTGRPTERYEDPWSFADDWGAEPPAEPVPVTVRTVLLGPVFLRVVLVVLFGFVWYRAFPLLPRNLVRYLPNAAWTLSDVARLVAAMVYPTYLVVYEALSGHVSDLVREVLNGAVSWVTRRYVDLRPKSSSYGCALHKLLREEVYAVLLAPLVLYAAAACADASAIWLKIMWGLVAVALGIDTLAACTRGGFVNVWSSSMAERVESRYLLMRAGLLKRCGEW